MSLNDGLILEFLEDHDLELPPKSIYHNLNRHGHEIGYSTVQLRVKELEQHGLLRKSDDAGYYEVTDLGRAYLEGDLDAEDLEEDEA